MFPNKVFVASNRKTKTGEATSYNGIITAIKEIYERQTQRNRLKVLNKLFDLSILSHHDRRFKLSKFLALTIDTFLK
jgi:ABC-type Na+ transport system ATPase subunit NatA